MRRIILSIFLLADEADFKIIFRKKMNKGDYMKSIEQIVIGFACMAALGGCGIFSPKESFNDALDGSAGFVATETNSMGSDVAGLMSPSGTAKMATETLYVEKIVVPWSYNQTLGCWTRTAEVTYGIGTRIRVDTVWLKDANGLAVDTPSFAAVATYRHVRNVTAKAANTFDFSWDMNVTINKNPGDTEFVFTGLGTGSFNGDVFRSTTITKVTRPWLAGSIPHLQFPTSGTINIDRVLRTIDIVFNGKGSATATVTRKSDGKTVVFKIQVQTGTETQ